MACVQLPLPYKKCRGGTFFGETFFRGGAAVHRLLNLVHGFY